PSDKALPLFCNLAAHLPRPRIGNPSSLEQRHNLDRRPSEEALLPSRRLAVRPFLRGTSNRDSFARLGYLGRQPSAIVPRLSDRAQLRCPDLAGRLIPFRTATPNRFGQRHFLGQPPSLREWQPFRNLAALPFPIRTSPLDLLGQAHNPRQLLADIIRLPCRNLG